MKLAADAESGPGQAQPHLSAMALASSAFLRLFFSSISRCSCCRISHRDFSCLLTDKNITVNSKVIALPAAHTAHKYSLSHILEQAL